LTFVASLASALSGQETTLDIVATIFFAAAIILELLNDGDCHLCAVKATSVR